MELDPYRLPYRPPILEDLPPSLARAVRAIPLPDVLRVARAAPEFSRVARDKGTGRPYSARRLIMYLPGPDSMTPAHPVSRAVGEEKARALCEELGGCHTSFPSLAMARSAARARQAFDWLDAGAPPASLVERLGVCRKHADNLAASLDMWRGGSQPAAIRAAKGCSRRLLALALAHDLNRPGEVVATPEPLPAPRLPTVGSLPGHLPALVEAVGMRDALTLSHVAESMGARIAAQLAESLGAPRVPLLPGRQLRDALRCRHALDLLALGYTPPEVVKRAKVPGPLLSALCVASAAWREGATLEAATRKTGTAALGNGAAARMALVLWREW